MGDLGLGSLSCRDLRPGRASLAPPSSIHSLRDLLAGQCSQPGLRGQGRAGSEVTRDVGQIVLENGPGCTLRPRPIRWLGGVVWLGLSGRCPVDEAHGEAPC